MKKIDAHITEHTFDKDGDIDHENGLRLLCGAIGIPCVTFDDVSEERWDQVLDWSNRSSDEYLAHILEGAGIEPSANGELTREIAMQIELART